MSARLFQDDPRLYERVHTSIKTALSYLTNSRNLEAPWKAPYADIFEALINIAGDDGKTVLACRQEYPIPPPSLKVDPNESLTGGLGTLYPDIDIVRFLTRERSGTMKLSNIRYEVIMELKRSIKRAYLRDKRTMKPTKTGYIHLIRSFGHAIDQVLRQASIAYRREGSPKNDVILFVAVGPWWSFAHANEHAVYSALGLNLENDDFETNVWRDAAEYIEAADTEASDAVDDIDLDASTPWDSRTFNLAEVRIPGAALTLASKGTPLAWSDPYLLGTEESWEKFLELGELIKARGFSA